MWLSGNDLTQRECGDGNRRAAISTLFARGHPTGIQLNGAYTNWATGEPNNNGGTGHYMVMYTNGLWDDEATMAARWRTVLYRMECR